MKIIQRYLLQLFLPAFVTAVLFFVLLLQLGDLFAHIVDYLQNGVRLRSILKIMLLYCPKCISYSIPLAILFAGAYTMGNLYARNELTSVFSAGVSLAKFTAPLLLFGFLLSVGMIFFEDRIVIKYFFEKNKLSKEILKREEDLNASNVVILSELGKIVYIADFYNAAEKTLSNASVVIRDDEGKLDIIVNSPYAEWKNDKWIFKEASVYRFLKNNSVEHLKKLPDNVVLSEHYENFQRNLSSVDEMTISTAKAFIMNLKKNGLPYYEALSLYYRRFSFPFTIFIVLFFSISLGGKFKKNILLMSILLSLGIASLFYITEMVTMLAAKWEYISPMAGAWTPIFVFSILSILLLQTAKT